MVRRRQKEIGDSRSIRTHRRLIRITCSQSMIAKYQHFIKKSPRRIGVCLAPLNNYLHVNDINQAAGIDRWEFHNRLTGLNGTRVCYFLPFVIIRDSATANSPSRLNSFVLVQDNQLKEGLLSSVFHTCVLCISIRHFFFSSFVRRPFCRLKNVYARAKVENVHINNNRVYNRDKSQVQR